MAKRARIGDVIEIPTAKGLAYAQLSHNVKRWGVSAHFAGLPCEPAGEILRSGWTERAVRRVLPLQVAVNRNIFEVVGHKEVPEHARPLPLFRAAGFICQGWSLIGYPLSQYRLSKGTLA